MQNKIEFRLGHIRIGIEVALRIIRARCKPNLKGFDPAFWKRFGSANSRGDAFAAKSIKVLFPGFQAGSVDFDGVIRARGRCRSAFADNTLKLFVGGHLPLTRE